MVSLHLVFWYCLQDCDLVTRGEDGWILRQRAFTEDMDLSGNSCWNVRTASLSANRCFTRLLRSWSSL